jgi:Cd(II)/Pb(II)-responsive transcriptional regulator
LARHTGVDIQTVRYYEKAGLLPPPTREANGYRAYGAGHLERLAFIRHCRALDMPLADVKRLLEFVARPEADCADVNSLIEAQLARVRARLASMRALERQLSALRAQCDANHAVRECGILDELVSAAHGEACACHDPAGPGTRAVDRTSGPLPDGQRRSVRSGSTPRRSRR